MSYSLITLWLFKYHNCKKNKVAAPYKSAEFVITYGKGLDREQELVGLGLSLGIINQAGAFYTMPEVTDERFQGRQKVSDALNENKELADKLEEIIKQKIKGASDVKLDKDEQIDSKIELNKNIEA